MNVLVLGVSGMLGHKVYEVFKASNHRVFGTMRAPKATFEEYGLFDDSVFDNLDARHLSEFAAIMLRVRPDVAINCIGLVKPRSTDPSDTIHLNALFPHQLARLCSVANCRLIHISTDCVFSGKEGSYHEESVPNASDLYGRSKLLGEVTYDGHLTIRTSIIGRELRTQRNLIEWFLSEKDVVSGYVNAIFTGLSTKALARVFLRIVERPEISGLMHVASESVNKYDLLCMVKEAFRMGHVTVQPYTDYYCDRSLVTERMRAAALSVPSMRSMVEEMAQEDTKYNLGYSALRSPRAANVP